jgi:hypothetical protein
MGKHSDRSGLKIVLCLVAGLLLVAFLFYYNLVVAVK